MKIAAIAASIIVGLFLLIALFFEKSNSQIKPNAGVVTINTGARNAVVVNRVGDALESPVEEITAKPSSETSDHDTLTEAMSRETRDAAWALKSERQLSNDLSSIASVRSINVDCRATQCRITGEIAQSGNENIEELIRRTSHAYKTGTPNADNSFREITTSYSIVSASPYVIRFSQLLASDR